MSKKYILESDIEIPFDKNIKYITIDLQECDKNKLYLLDESAIEQKGAEKAWALARWAFSEADDYDLEEAFPYEWDNGGFRAIMSLSYDEAREKYELWQKKKTADDEITVGDEVTDNYSTAVVLYTHGQRVGLLFNSGINSGIAQETYKKDWKKTGRFFPELTELLKKIGGNE